MLIFCQLFQAKDLTWRNLWLGWNYHLFIKEGFFYQEQLEECDFNQNKN